MGKTYGRGGQPSKTAGDGLAPKRPKPTVQEPQGEFGGHTPVNPRYLFGEPEEIDNRVATGYKASGGTNPAAAAPSFEQIRPGPTGKSANEPEFNKNYGTSNNYDGNPRRYV